MWPLVSFAIAAVGAVICLALAWRARRWRRRGDHPHCRRCDFDLYGLPAGAGRCSECGADLTAKRAMAIGARRPMRFAQGAAVVAALALAVVAVRVGRGVNWYRSAARVSPTALLIRELGGDGRACTVAAEELDRRVQTDAYQGDALLQVLKALQPASIVARPIARVGGEVPFGKVFGPRTRQPATLDWGRYVIERSFDRYRFGDGPWRVPSEIYSSWNPSPPGSSRPFDERWTSSIRGDSIVGPSRLECVFRVRLVRRDQDPRFISDMSVRRDYRANDPFVVEWEQAATAAVEFVASDGDRDVEYVRDERLRDAVRRAITVGDPKNADASVRPSRVEIVPAMDAFIGAIAIDDPPVAVAFEMFLRDPTRGMEYPIGWARGRPGRREVSDLGFGESEAEALLKGWTSPVGELVFRPFPPAARGSTDLVRIWGDEVVLKNVPIEIYREPPTTVPAPLIRPIP